MLPLRRSIGRDDASDVARCVAPVMDPIGSTPRRASISMRYNNIEISAGGISEYQDGRAVLTVPFEKILAASLGRGSGSQRPLVTFLVGLALLVVGISPCIALCENGLPWSSGASRGVRQFGTGILMMPVFLIPGGLWLLHHTLRRRWFIAVRMQGDRQKLVVDEPVDATELRAMLSRAEESHGLRIGLGSDAP